MKVAGIGVASFVGMVGVLIFLLNGADRHGKKRAAQKRDARHSLVD